MNERIELIVEVSGSYETVDRILDLIQSGTEKVYIETSMGVLIVEQAREIV